MTEFNEVYKLPSEGEPHFIAPSEVSDEQVKALNQQLDALRVTQERLQERCESDGLVVALVAYCAERSLLPEKFSRVVFDAAEVLEVPLPKEYWDRDPKIPEELLTRFLESEGLSYTHDGLSFYLQACGLSPKKVRAGQAISLSRLARPLRDIPAPLII